MRFDYSDWICATAATCIGLIELRFAGVRDDVLDGGRQCGAERAA